MNDQTTNKESSEISDDVLTIERILKATPEKVFDAFASAEALSQWFGPEVCEVLEAEVDFREGGKYRLRMTTDSDGEIDLVGVYQTIDRPGHLAFSWRWEDNPDYNPCNSFVELMFHEHPEGTLLRLVQTGIDDDQDRSNHNMGWDSTLNDLERYLASA